MKTENNINEYLIRCEKSLSKKQKEYNGFDQITASDSVGIRLEDEIKSLKGEIKALKWVIKSNGCPSYPYRFPENAAQEPK